MSLDLDVGGEVKHTISFSGKVTIGSATKGGEVYFTFDPGDYLGQMNRAENAIRLLEYAKHLYYHPEAIPPITVKDGTATAKVG